MKNMPIVEKAILKAMWLHAGQTRKDDGQTPYIVHPLSVGLLLARFTTDQNIIAAGILHDTIEDTAYTKEELARDFGDTIAGIVMEVTELPKPTPWKQRKEAYLKHLKIASHEAHMVCLADKTHNLQSMINSYHEQGEKLWEKFNQGNSLWFYEQVLQILEEQVGMKDYAKELKEILEEAKKTFQGSRTKNRKISFVECENESL